MRAQHYSLFWDLTRRELRSRWSQSGAGWLWLVLSPLLLLSVYGFVFGIIFAARVPDDLQVSFIAWLAVGLWPWLAFSDSTQQASQAMLQHRQLMSKIAVPRELLVLSSQAAPFIIHSASFMLVLVVIHLLGNALNWFGLLHLLLLVGLLQLFAMGLALWLACAQVLFRDLKQILPTLMMLWFFLTPIIYAPSLLPEAMQRWLGLNPMTWWMEEIRAAMFVGKSWPDQALLGPLIISAVALVSGVMVFRRLSPHFEDFL